MGWVANRVDERMLYPLENIQAIAQRMDAPLLGTVPRLAVASAAAAAAYFQ
jgi:dethiobiotin synthetase